MTHSLDMDFVNHEKSPLPSPPEARIYIKNYGSDKDGKIYITPKCVSISEFEYEVNRLQKELEDLRRKARKKYDR